MWRVESPGTQNIADPLSRLLDGNNREEEHKHEAEQVMSETKMDMLRAQLLEELELGAVPSQVEAARPGGRVLSHSVQSTQV